MNKILTIATFALISFFSTHAKAEFIISSAIIEFNSRSGKQHDIEVISRSETNDYIEIENYEIISAGENTENKKLLDDPIKSGLLITPDKMILPAGSRKIIRFVLLNELGDTDKIYRVAIKPVIKGLEGETTVGLKILVGYEALVIIRPKEIKSSFQFKRNGKKLQVQNSGNSNILIQSGTQCINGKKSEFCKKLPAMRIYAGQMHEIDLPYDKSLTYSIWDGLTFHEQKID